MRLYTWNTAISAAFYGPLQGLEVALRNAMSNALTATYGVHWYDSAACGFDAGTLNRIMAAKNELQREGYPVDPPHLRQAILVATAAPVMRPPMAWTRAVATAMMPLQSCLCTV